MADETAKLKVKLANLNNSLDGLEEALEPLLSQSLPETVVNLETIQQAKLQVAIPYLVYDLVFIYLKTRGIDPRTHPVIAELDRVRQYFDKIKNAENPPQRTLPVDKDAANRFIKHAISQVRQMAPVAGPSTHVIFDDAGTAHDIRAIPVKVTEKMLAREEYQRELREVGSDEEEEELEVIDDAVQEEEEEEEEPSAADRKGKGKAASTAEEVHTELGSKRRRRPVDPFAGYGDEVQQMTTTTTTIATTVSKSSAKRVKTMATQEDVSMSDAPASGISTPTSVASSGKSKAKKSKKRS